MTEQRKGAVVTMVVLAALLAGIGVWQFGNLGLGGGEEHESEDEHEYEYEERYSQHGETALPSGDASVMLERIASEENARIVEVEREREHGRDVYELKLAEPDGRVREIKVDAGTGEVIDRD